jgi:hypothetical protein
LLTGPVLEVTMEVRLYRERPELARHAKSVAQAMWDFLRDHPVAGPVSKYEP